jgi:formylglycine-generating enzyme required for sulfatase activity
LVTDDIKGSDNMFSAQLIDAKESKVEGKGSHIRTGVGASELPRISLVLARQLAETGRRRSAPAPTRSYPAELDIEMVFVEGGTFQMGCQASDGKCNTPRNNYVMTKHAVTVGSFSIGKYEITQAQWKAVMRGHPLENIYYWGGNRNNPGQPANDANCGNVPCDDQRPMENISWYDVDTAFLPRLRKLTGKQYRLPTDAEWEYAARGCKGGQCESFQYGGSDVLSEVAWSKENANGTTHPVGQKKPNSLGIYDITANVSEWCSDNWRTDYNSAEDATLRLIRNGSIGNEEWEGWHRVVARVYRTLDRHSGDLGFRVVLPAQ